MRRELGPGEGLGAQGHGRWAVLVLAGIVRLLIRADGVEPTLAYASHGALLGSHLVPRDESVPIDIQALTPSVVIQLPAQPILELIQTEGPFTRAVVDHAQALSVRPCRSSHREPPRICHSGSPARSRCCRRSIRRGG